MPIHTQRPGDAAGPTTLLFGMTPPPDDLVQLPEGISLCMIVKNEERFLEECLRSVQGIVDEICIVDTGSTDRTIEIAEKFGARIEHRKWRDDFAWARNEAITMATRRWILSLDGDEEIAPESRRWLLDLRTVPADQTVLYCRIHNNVSDHGSVGMMSHSLPRIYPNSPKIRYSGVIHETLIFEEGKTKASAVITPIRILHKGYTNELLAERNKEARNAPLLQRAVEIAEDDSFSWFNYGNYLLGRGRWEEGIEALERMVAMERGKEMRGFRPLGHVFLAGAYSEHHGDFERAMETIDECLELLPEYVLALYTKAEIFARAGRYEEAREWLKKTLATRAKEDLHNVVDDEIVLWKAQLNIATSYVKEERYEEAIPWLEEANRNKPDLWVIQERLAWLFERVRRYFDAEIVLREAFERSASEASAIAYVNYLARRQRMTRALEVIEEAMPRASDQTKAGLHVATAAIVRKMQTRDPVPSLLAALALAPGNGQALNMLEELYRERGDELSLARLRRDEMNAPLVNADDYLRRSHRLAEEHRYEEAAAVAAEGLSVTPLNAGLLFNLGLALAQAEGGAERAIEVLSRARIGELEIIQTAAFLQATLLEQLGRFDEAFKVIAEIFGELPEHEDALLLRTRMLEHLGRSDEAEKDLRASMRPGRRRVAIELASLMLRAGRYAEASTVAAEGLATA